MSLSEEALETSAAAASPALATRAAEPYDADAKAFAPTGVDRYQQFAESIKGGATLELSLACANGQRESLALTAKEAMAWLTAEHDDRVTFANGKIRENHARIALAAVNRLRERGLPVTHEHLRPAEEAYLREFGILADVRVPADEGYVDGIELREAAIDDVGRALREDGFWNYGTGSDSYGVYNVAPTQREYLPRGGPQGQQMLISDVWEEQAKAYYAWTHDPVARQACELIADFVLGRGVTVDANDDAVQAVIDEFWEREAFDRRLHDCAVSIARDGELFGRKIPLGDGRLKLRTLPPETIWEIVTDAEDPLDVYWYVQRFQTRTVLYADNLPAARTRWVERTILADDMIHIKVNAKESDVRGRSDLYVGLGWMKRLRDYFDAIVQKEYAAAAYQWHYKINGGQPDVDRIAAAASTDAQAVPGSSFFTNDQVDVISVASTVKTVSGEGSAYEALLNHIAIGFGLSKDYFGANTKTNRASALVATEPAAKRFEARQDIIRGFIEDVLDAVVAEARRAGKLDGVSDFSYSITFPSIIKADSTARGQMIRQAEAMGYLSKETAATQFVGEIEIDNYDYDTECEKLQRELGGDVDVKRLISRDMQMVKKGLPEPGDIAWDPGEVPNPDASGSTPGSTQATSTASPTSGAGAAKIRDEQGRGGAMDASSMEAAIREARKSGAIVLVP